MCRGTRKDRIRNEYIRENLTNRSNRQEKQGIMFEMVCTHTHKTKTSRIELVKAGDK